MSWSDLLALGERQDDALLKARMAQVRANRCCHLVYTSGTTGAPKGVMLSHDNLVYTARVLCDVFAMRGTAGSGNSGGCERIVSYLPLSHVAANVTDIFVMMACAGAVYFADKGALKGVLFH